MSYLHQFIIGAAMLLPAFASAENARLARDPSDPADKGSIPAYQSAFAAYQPLQESSDVPETHWRALNEEVARVGGHAGVLKDPAPSRAAASATTAAPASGQHQMHHEHHAH